MKHARKDYQCRIIDLEHKIPAEEPVFLIRGQDTVAPMILRMYAKAADDHGASPELVASVYDQAAAMEDWQLTTKKKVADAPAWALQGKEA